MRALVMMVLGLLGCASSGVRPEVARETAKPPEGPWPALDGGVLVANRVEVTWRVPEAEPIEEGRVLELRHPVAVERLPPELRALVGVAVRGIDRTTADCPAVVRSFHALARVDAFESLYPWRLRGYGSTDTLEMWRAIPELRERVWSRAVLVADVDEECMRDVWIVTTHADAELLMSGTLPEARVAEAVAAARTHGFVETAELDYRDTLEELKRREDEQWAPSKRLPQTWDSAVPGVIALEDAQRRTHGALVRLGNRSFCKVPPAWFLVYLDGDAFHAGAFGVEHEPTAVARIGGAFYLYDREADGAVELRAADGTSLFVFGKVMRGVLCR